MTALEERVREALESEAARRPVDVDALWQATSARIGPEPRWRRVGRPLLVGAATLAVVVAATVLWQRDGSAPVDGGSGEPPTATRPTPASTPDRFELYPRPMHTGPLPRELRDVDLRHGRVEIFVVDARPGEEPPSEGPVGTILTYAYPCFGESSRPVCLTRVDTGLTGLVKRVSIERAEYARLRILPWQSARGAYGALRLVAYAAPADSPSATVAFGGGEPRQATRVTGKGWPFTLYLALGPPTDSVTVRARTGHGTIEINHADLVSR